MSKKKVNPSSVNKLTGIKTDNMVNLKSLTIINLANFLKRREENQIILKQENPIKLTNSLWKANLVVRSVLVISVKVGKKIEAIHSITWVWTLLTRKNPR